MLLMITGVGSAVFVYAGGYMRGHRGQRRLYVLLSLFMLAMIGCVTTDDLFVLFLCWEATSVLSFPAGGLRRHARLVAPDRTRGRGEHTPMTLDIAAAVGALLCAGAALIVADGAWAWRLALIIGFLLATLPVGAHLLARAAVREAGLDAQIAAAPRVQEPASHSTQI
jgi:MFS family permease